MGIYDISAVLLSQFVICGSFVLMINMQFPCCAYINSDFWSIFFIAFLE